MKRSGQKLQRARLCALNSALVHFTRLIDINYECEVRVIMINRVECNNAG